MFFCKYCGQQLFDQAKFCVKCGKQLKFDKPAQATQIVPEAAMEPMYQVVPEPVVVSIPQNIPDTQAVPENNAGGFQPVNLQKTPDFGDLGIQYASNSSFDGETTVLKSPVNETFPCVSEQAPEVENLLRLRRTDTGEEIQFVNKKTIRVGRNAGNDIQLTDSLISGYHATFEWDECEWLLTDESRNGSTINDIHMERGRCYALEAGSIITFATAVSFEYLGCQPDVMGYVSPFDGIDNEELVREKLIEVMNSENSEEYMLQVYCDAILRLPIFVPVKYHGVDPFGNIITKPVSDGITIRAFTRKEDLEAIESDSAAVKMNREAFIKLLHNTGMITEINVSRDLKFTVSTEMVNEIFVELA